MLPDADQDEIKLAFRRLARRYHPDRAPDPETEVLVLNGSREGLFLAAIAAARYVPKRDGTPAMFTLKRVTEPMLVTYIVFQSSSPNAMLVG